MNKLGKALFLTIGILLVFGGILHAQQVVGTRDFRAVEGGDSMTYTIDVAMDESNLPDAVLIEETLPVGWTLSSATPTISKDDSGVISWLFITPDYFDAGIVIAPDSPISKLAIEDTTITLTVAWDGGCGEATFNGNLKHHDTGSQIVQADLVGDSIGMIPLGDVNDDGEPDIFDCLLIARAAANLPNVGSFIAVEADVNCDGIADIFDALLIARNAANLPNIGWCTDICSVP